jgi:hypothetical protein
MRKIKTLHFVYIGNKFPNYINSAIDLASRFSGLEVHLISNEQNRVKVLNKSIKFFSLEDFYDPDEFRSVSRYIELPSSFRNGFWHKSLERLFVLEQFSTAAGLNSVFHAELDQLLFGTNLLAEKLQGLPGHGIYVPFHTKSAAVASIMYWNDTDSFRSLLDYAGNGNMFPHEMSLIANWARENPSKVFGLPTLSTCLNADKAKETFPHRMIDKEEIGGIVDAAQIGQWVAGIDPRNIPFGEIPVNKYVDKPIETLLSREQLDSLIFKIDCTSKSIIIQSELQDDIQIYNLHLHSKIHKWINKSDRNLQKIFWLVNQDYVSKVPSARKIQFRQYLIDSIFLIAKNPKEIFCLLKKFKNKLIGSR